MCKNISDQNFFHTWFLRCGSKLCLKDLSFHLKMSCKQSGPGALS